MSGPQDERRPTSDFLSRIGELGQEAVVLKAERDELRLQSEAAKSFTRRIAHDFNNLLQAIASKAELILEDVTTSDEGKRLAMMIAKAAVRGAGFTKQLLSFSRSGELPEPGAAGPEAPTTRGIAAGTSGLAAPPGRILVAEDEDDSRALARTLLSKAGHDVTVVSNGSEALAALERESFDLVLMDIDMPVMDGLTAARKIRQLASPSAKVPIIAVTGAPLDAQRNLLAETGLSDYLAKPFEFSALLKRINFWLAEDVGRDRTWANASTPRARASLDQAEGLMGRAWVETGLRKLVGQIDELSTLSATIATDAESLVARAHAMVSLAGLLGFADLSERCVALEQAAKENRDVGVSLDEAKAAAAQARSAAIEALGNSPTAAQDTTDHTAGPSAQGAMSAERFRRLSNQSKAVKLLAVLIFVVSILLWRLGSGIDTTIWAAIGVLAILWLTDGGYRREMGSLRLAPRVAKTDLGGMLDYGTAGLFATLIGGLVVILGIGSRYLLR